MMGQRIQRRQHPAVLPSGILNPVRGSGAQHHPRQKRGIHPCLPRARCPQTFLGPATPIAVEMRVQMGIVLAAEAAGLRTVVLGVGSEVASGGIEAGGQEVRHVIVAVGEEAEVPVFGVGGDGGAVFVVYDKPYYLAVAIVDINSGRFLVVVRESEADGICCFRFIVAINKEGQMWFGMTARFGRMVMMRVLVTTRFFRMLVRVLVTVRFF